jgi:hypothetical protein
VAGRRARYDPCPTGAAGPFDNRSDEEDTVVEWLAPIALFWTCAALYLGGFRIEIRGGGGVRQLIGLLDTFVLYMAVWFVVRLALRGLLGPIGAVVAGCLIAIVLLPVLSRIGFMVMGVRITKAAA